MPKTLKKSRLQSNEDKPKIKPEVNNTKSNIPPNLQTYKEKLLFGNSLLYINELRIFSIIR